MRRTSVRSAVGRRRPVPFVRTRKNNTDTSVEQVTRRPDLRHLERIVGSQPLQALTLAREALGDTEDADLLRIVGLSLAELGRLGEARRCLERSVAAADTAGDRSASAAARISLAHVLLYEGDLTYATELLEHVVATGNAGERLRSMVNLSLVQHRRHLHSLATETARHALNVALEAGDVAAELRSVINLGVFALESGDMRSAVRSFEHVEALAAETNDQYSLLRAHHNRGVAEMRMGNVPKGFQLMAEAIARLRSSEAGLALSRALLDHADALLGASLLREAAEAIDESIALATRAGAASEVADAWMRAGNVALLRVRYGAAREATTIAVPMLEALDRSADARHSALVGMTAGLLAGEHVDLHQLGELIRNNEFEPTRSTVDVRLSMAQSLRRLGLGDAANAMIVPLIALERSASPLMRISGFEARALHGLFEGDLTTAHRAAGAGLRLIARHALALGSTELRLGMTRRIDELASVRIEVGVRRSQPSDVVMAIEERGNAAVALGEANGSPNGGQVAALTDLRTVITQLAAPGLDIAQRSALEARERRIERDVRNADRSRTDGPVTTTSSRAAYVRQRRSGLTTLLFGDAGGACFRVVDGIARRVTVRVGDVDELRVPLEQLRLVTRRLVGDATGRWRAAFDELCAHVGELLLCGVSIAGAEAVLVIPSASVADVPWAALPQLRGVPLSVSPSMRLASRKSGWSGALSSVVAVAGPDLVHASEEVRAVARIHGGRFHAGRAATSGRTRRAFGTADLVHLAAHGVLREDNPSMSSLLLADGPLTVYDLEDLPRLAPFVVLSSCSVARPDKSASATVSSFIAALLAKGASTVIAATDRVDDAATASLMTELHGELSFGTPAATALSRAQRRERHRTAYLFTCWGAAPIAS